MSGEVYTNLLVGLPGKEGWGEGRLGAELPPSPPCLLASLSALPLILKSRGWHTAPGNVAEFQAHLMSLTWANYILQTPLEVRVAIWSSRAIVSGISEPGTAAQAVRAAEGQRK